MQQTKKTEENNIKTRQQIKKGRSKRCCRRQSTWLIIALLSYGYRSAVALLSLHCRTAVAPPLSLCCRASVAPLSHRYCSTIAPLLSHLLLLRSCTAIAPISWHCRSAAVAPAVATQSLLLSHPLSLCFHAIVEPLLLRYHFCRSVAADVAPDVRTVSLLLSLLLSITPVASRGRIRVTVFIGDCQACVSSSSEGCSTSQKKVKV